MISTDPDTFVLHGGELTGYRGKYQYTPTAPRPAQERIDGTWYYSSIQVKFRDGSVRHTDPESAELGTVLLYEHSVHGCQIERAYVRIIGV